MRHLIYGMFDGMKHHKFQHGAYGPMNSLDDAQHFYHKHDLRHMYIKYISGNYYIVSRKDAPAVA